MSDEENMFRCWNCDSFFDNEPHICNITKCSKCYCSSCYLDCMKELEVYEPYCKECLKNGIKELIERRESIKCIHIEDKIKIEEKEYCKFCLVEGIKILNHGIEIGKNCKIGTKISFQTKNHYVYTYCQDCLMRGYSLLVAIRTMHCCSSTKNFDIDGTLYCKECLKIGIRIISGDEQ